MTTKKLRPHNPEALRNTLFACCKRWIAACLVLKGVVFLGGAVTVLFSVTNAFAPLVIAVLMAASEICMWRSDFVKGVAESLHRKLDLEDSFGWQITNAEMRDLLARVRIDPSVLTAETTANYFASEEVPSPRRALENLQESAWWSKHLAESMWKICLAVICLLMIGCLLLIIVSVQTVKDQAAIASIGKVVTSAILLVFSFGLLRYTVGYFMFSKKAERTEEAAKDVLHANAVQEVEAIKLWQDYQLSRASAPLIPTWIWRKREEKLNELWRLYRG